MTCALCEQPIDTSARASVRFSNTSPPWTFNRGNLVGAIAAMGEGIAAVIRTAQGAPMETYWFHRSCWDMFRTDLLTPT